VRELLWGVNLEGHVDSNYNVAVLLVSLSLLTSMVIG